MDEIETHVVRVHGPSPDSKGPEDTGFPHSSHLEVELCPGQEGFTSQVLALAHLLTTIDNCMNDDVRALGLKFAEALGAKSAAEKANILTMVKKD